MAVTAAAAVPAAADRSQAPPAMPKSATSTQAPSNGIAAARPLRPGGVRGPEQQPDSGKRHGRVHEGPGVHQRLQRQRHRRDPQAGPRRPGHRLPAVDGRIRIRPPRSNSAATTRPRTCGPRQPHRGRLGAPKTPSKPFARAGLLRPGESRGGPTGDCRGLAGSGRAREPDASQSHNAHRCQRTDASAHQHAGRYPPGEQRDSIVQGLHLQLHRASPRGLFAARRGRHLLQLAVNRPQAPPYGTATARVCATSQAPLQ